MSNSKFNNKMKANEILKDEKVIKRFESKETEFKESDLTDLKNDIIQDITKSNQTEVSKKTVILSNLPYIYDMLVEGSSVIDICRKLGISKMTWYNLRKTSQQFRTFLVNVEKEQVQTAKQTLIKKTRDRYVKDNKVLANGKVVQYDKHIEADFKALKYYLNNKLPEEFKDKHEVEIRKTNITVDIIDLPDSEVKEVLHVTDGSDKDFKSDQFS